MDRRTYAPDGLNFRGAALVEQYQIVAADQEPPTESSSVALFKRPTKTAPQDWADFHPERISGYCAST